jgi:hypothetical protein
MNSVSYTLSNAFETGDMEGEPPLYGLVRFHRSLKKYKYQLDGISLFLLFSSSS